MQYSFSVAYHFFCFRSPCGKRKFSRLYFQEKRNVFGSGMFLFENLVKKSVKRSEVSES